MGRKERSSAEMVTAARQAHAPDLYIGWERLVNMRAWRTSEGKIVADLDLVKMGVR